MRFFEVFWFFIFCCWCIVIATTSSESNGIELQEREGLLPFPFPTKIPTSMPTMCSSFPSVELSVLEDLYNTTDGPNWNYGPNGNPWNFSQRNPNPCAQNWAFINCYHCVIIDLLIENANLVGTIPSSIKKLTFLEVCGFLHLSVGNKVIICRLVLSLYRNLKYRLLIN